MQNQLFRKVSLERLSSPEQLDQLMTLTNPRGWLGLLGVFALLGALVLWSFFGLVTTKIDASGVIIEGNGPATWQAVLYLPFHQSKQVVTGMPVQISPATPEVNTVGYISGQVASVSPYPVTEEEIFSRLGNKGMAKLFCEQGVVVEVCVAFNPDEKGQPTFKHSPGIESGKQIKAYELCTASIITSQQKPITLILPMR